MDPAIDARKLKNSGRVVILTSAAIAMTGCASGGGVWHSSASAMSGLLWSRATAPAEGYDYYAQNMASSKAMTANREGDHSPDRDPSQPAAEGREAGGGEGDKSTSPSNSTADPKVRVTLGRPETVPIVPGGIERRAGTQLASSAPASADAGLLADRTAGERRASAEPRGADPAPEPEPAPELAPAPALAAEAPEVRSPAKPTESELKDLLDRAREKLEAMSTYQVAITRTERVGNQLLPEEKALLSIRRNPKAVRLEWPDGANKGREVIYSAAIDAKSMRVKVAPGAIPIPPMTMAVDSPLVMRNSRHAITEAGFDTIFNNLSGQIDAQGRPTGEGGRLTYKGLHRPEGIDRDCHLIQRITPTKEIWRVYLDPDTLMPAAVVAQQADGALLESYRYEHLKADPVELAAAEAFDPDKRWGASKGGLFSRLANAAASAEPPAPTATR